MPDSMPPTESEAERAEAQYLRPYELAVQRYGPSFEATLWHSKERQQERFGVISSLVDLVGARILDAGCGLGDLAAFLNHHGIEFTEYVGLEALGDVVDAASARGLARARFAVADFVDDAGAFEDHFPEAEGGRADVIIFSGSLNTLDERQASAVLDRAWEVCHGALAFNFLSARHGDRSSPDPKPAYRFDPMTMLEWALERSPRVLFRQDYMNGHDATIAMLRGRSALE